MSWYYKPRLTTVNGVRWYDVVEYYARDKNFGPGWTSEGIVPGGDNKKELIECLELMLKDVKKHRTFIDKKKYKPKVV